MQDSQQENRKKRVLLVTEFSQLNTGFSVMANDILIAMHNSGKYEVAELASYLEDGSPRINTVPWRVYPVIPSDPKENQEYQQNYRTSQFGSHRFDKAVIDFKPDIVFSYRDFWHDEWITKSASRYLFNYVWSACIDSEPPKIDWMGIYSTVDKMTSYTDWGMSVLKKYSGRQLKMADTNTMPGVDQNVFKPIKKSDARLSLGIKDDINVVLTVMRNQPRKLFPDLMFAFSKTLETWNDLGRTDLVDNTYLYLHTSYPDVGFDIGKDILKYKLSSKVLMTYCCNHCHAYFASFFNGEICACNNCGNFTAHPPNTAMGLTREQLAVVYNTADLYAQLSIAGALEIPLIEAKACGVPTIATDYAAMHEINSLGGSYGSIKVSAWREESDKETGQIRAMPDPIDCSKKIADFFMESKSFKEQLSIDALNTVKRHHSNEDTYNKWDKIFDSMPFLPDDRWYKKPNLIDTSKIDLNVAYNDEDFINYLVFNFTPPKAALRAFAARKELSAALKTKIKTENNTSRKLNRSDIVTAVVQTAHQFNAFEQFRYGVVNKIKNTIDMVEVV